MEATVSNPLARLSGTMSLPALRGASVAGRIFGAGMALLIAFDQSYDPTQVFTVAVALVIVASLAQPPGALGDALAALGAGIVFFAGSVLTHFQPGMVMLAMGLLAGLAALAFAHRSGRDVTLPAGAFIAGALLTAPLQAAIVFAFE